MCGGIFGNVASIAAMGNTNQSINKNLGLNNLVDVVFACFHSIVDHIPQLLSRELAVT